jgi:hypothetical protein
MLPYVPIIVAALTTQPLIGIPRFLPFFFILVVSAKVEAVPGMVYPAPIKGWRGRASLVTAAA